MCDTPMNRQGKCQYLWQHDGYLVTTLEVQRAETKEQPVLSHCPKQSLRGKLNRSDFTGDLLLHLTRAYRAVAL